jgi:Flp pilus assembly protein TadB
VSPAVGWAGEAWLAGLAAAATVLLALPVRPRRPGAGVRPPRRTGGHWMVRWRVPLAVCGGAGAALFVGGPAGPVAGLAGAAATWWFAGSAEPAAERRRRELVARELPHVVHLLGAALRSGAAPAEAVRLVATALPGPAADRLRPASEQLALGADPERVWETLGADESLAPLGRTLARAHRTGAPVVAAVERLADELAREARAGVEDRARSVGVRAALPLGLCLLPAFLLLGIVPLVAGLVSGFAVG